MTRATLRADELYAWMGSSLLVVNSRGSCASDIPVRGYYYREARYLSTLELRLNGDPPWLCHTAIPGPHRLVFDYTYPELTRFGGGGSGSAGDGVTRDRNGIPHRALDLRAVYRIGIAELRIDLLITNRSRSNIDLVVAWMVDADFADLAEALGTERLQCAPVDAAPRDQGLLFSYQHPDLPYRTNIAVGGPGDWRITPNELATTVRLMSQRPVQLTLVVCPEDFRDVLSPDGLHMRERVHDEWARGLCRISVPGNGIVEEIFRRQREDIASLPLLDGREDEWLAPQAGVPLYPALFGRDALTAGWQATMLDRGQSIDQTLNRLARLQGERDDPWRDEEPGRIVQQVRMGPLARLDLTPFSRYYGDFASPMMFILGLAHLYSWTGERTVLARHWDAARRIVDWARDRGDRDGDGYLEYLTRSPAGPKHQGWKDSGDAIVADDGSPVPAPIAPCEIQGYWYAVQQVMAVLSGIMNARSDARALWRAAADLKERFNRDWWIPEESIVPLALGPDKQVVRAPSSNMGQCLATGIVNAEHLPPLVGRLFAPDLFSGWGIRTLSSTHRAYNPIGYHLGSVWPVENATIVFGLRRFGFDARALELSHALIDLAALYTDHRVPECVGGYPRVEGAPGAYPRANAPQLWNASGYALILQSILGLQPLAPLDTLVVDPILPTWLPEVILHDLRFAGATATLRFWRDGQGASHAEVLQRRGTLHLVRQPPPESLSAGLGDRFRALADGVLHL